MLSMPARILAALAFALAAATPAVAQDAFTNRDTELKERAEAQSRTLANLPENTAVRLLVRGGGWSRVEARGQSGWVRVFHLRFPHTAQAAQESTSLAGGLLGSLGSAITGQRAPARTNLATTGVRGLSQEELRDARPDPQALAKLQGYRADRAAAERFAREGKLVPVRIEEGGGSR